MSVASVAGILSPVFFGAVYSASVGSDALFPHPGAAFLIVFDTKDGSLNNLKAKSAVGPAIQAGSNFMINDKYGAFIDVKKAWVGTVATATLGPMPVVAKVKVDPIVVNAGLTYRF